MDAKAILTEQTFPPFAQTFAFLGRSLCGDFIRVDWHSFADPGNRRSVPQHDAGAFHSVGGDLQIAAGRLAVVDATGEVVA
jgi:hypothetical protein